MTSRRSVLGAVPLAVGALPFTGGAAWAAQGRRISRDLRPGGAFDRYIKELAGKDEFSGTVLLAHRGRPVLTRSYGMADRERGIPNRHDTVYALASTSKVFTGLAAVHLAQRGKLHFYDTVGTHLKGLPKDIADHVNVHHLLTHTAGLGDARRPGEEPPREEVFDNYEDQMAAFWKNVREYELEFTPGTRKAYSSMGYTLLGELIAKVAGMPFQEYVRKHIFLPARMTGAGYYNRAQWLSDKRIAHPYMYQKDGSRVDAVRNLDKGAVYGDAGGGSNSARNWMGTGGGNGFASALDMLRFSVAVRRGTLLSRPFHELYVNGKISAPPLRPSDDPKRGEGFHAYGPAVSLYDGERVITHGGGAGGISTNWSVYLDLDWSATILCNYDLRSIEPIIALERRLVTA
ncbi:serine hydrolase domain-containing protein [Actinomadura fulvescens]|uniref:Serine hydrolase domain-containing protein n=1 Tax=Actinomadura fulvescens TaxID=46160 RepID=A0ABN3PDE2_9ACTN